MCVCVYHAQTDSQTHRGAYTSFIGFDIQNGVYPDIIADRINLSKGVWGRVFFYNESCFMADSLGRSL